ncbi:MAG: hypothetical protein Q8Q15_00610 [bacterium]|nr:hypothetical protein [bacterium]
MKLFFSEFKADYDKYYFPYQVWLVREEGDDNTKIYYAGFLPVRNLSGVYYLTRSLRVNLSKFSLSSENRRILNKTADFEYQLLPIAEFEYTPEVQKFCKEYMDKRFRKGQITAVGIKNIFQKGVYNYVFVWRKVGIQPPVGYAVCFVDNNLLQYAHAFYDLKLFEQNIGVRMLLQAVAWAKENGKEYAYLGTVYNKSAISYKTEFSGFEYFNGFTWSVNLAELKTLVDWENEKYLLRDQDYLAEFYPEGLKEVLNKYGVRVNF